MTSRRTKHRSPFLLLGLTLGVAVPQGASAATVMRARDSALVEPADSWSSGIFNPLRYAVTDRLQLSVHPIIFFLAPHASLQVVHWQRGPWTVAGDYGVAFPWPAVKALQGHLFPSFDRGGGRVGFAILPSAGLRLSHQCGDRVATLKLDMTGRVPLTPSDLRPLEAPAPLEFLFAPLLSGYRLRAGGLWDAPLTSRWRWRAYVDVFLHGVDSDHSHATFDHVTLRGGGGADWSWSPRWRLAMGVVVWNANQFAVDDRGFRHRSTDVLPVIDVIWSQPAARTYR